MKEYSLPSYLEDIYSRYPEADKRPVIGITANYTDGDATLRDRYYKQVVAAGGVPVIIPPVADSNVIINTLDGIDGLLLTGGGDYNPLWAGEQPSPLLHSINAERDLPELLITRLAYNRQIPMLGICRGIQTLAMALDGEVAQDLSLLELPVSLPPCLPEIKHSQDADRSETTHTVNILPDTLLHKIYSLNSLSPCLPVSLQVNSFHHQAVRNPGKHFRVSATSPDGVIEAMESSEEKPIIGVQWHPEWLADGLPLFQWLVDEAALFNKAKELHSNIITLDTHCDTPMLLAPLNSQNSLSPCLPVFNHRDPKMLVDLHKMTEGRQQAVTMAAYLPQTLEENPKEYADNIFNTIEEIISENSNYIAQARTPEDIELNRRAGKRSILFAIENGLALNHDVRNVEHFARRGVTYITLCHNGDNDLCDAASRTTNTHGGVSQFGAEVIKEMNRLGILVDLSHGGEKSFYDALEISKTPIVCSHSSCRALCDHQRNLTDDQMRALARKGGVAHITLYPGFLRKDGEATILDALEHLKHAIDIMGIEHVGLGTDFDGDGGVPGLADSSELLNFTRHLLRRRYSDEEITMIWGGNWLRLMRQVQNV